MRHADREAPMKSTVRLGQVVLTGRKIELTPRRPTPEEPELLRPEEAAVPRAPAPVAHRPQPSLPPGRKEWVKRKPGGRHGIPVTIRVGPKCKVPVFKPGDRVRIVDEPEPNCPCPQLTPADMQAIADILRRRGVQAPDFSDDLSPDERAAVSEAERVWIGVLAALDRFPGSEVIQ
jgi:hypothetical protein